MFLTAAARFSYRHRHNPLSASPTAAARRPPLALRPQKSLLPQAFIFPAQAHPLPPPRTLRNVNRRRHPLSQPLLHSTRFLPAWPNPLMRPQPLQLLTPLPVFVLRRPILLPTLCSGRAVQVCMRSVASCAAHPPTSRRSLAAATADPSCSLCVARCISAICNRYNPSPPGAPLYFHLTPTPSPSCQRPPGLCAVLHWPCRPLPGPPPPPPALFKLHPPPFVSQGEAVTRDAGAYHNVKQRSCTCLLWYRRRCGCCSCSCYRLQCCRCDLRRSQRRRQHICITCRERRAVATVQLQQQQQVSSPLLSSTPLIPLCAVFRTFVASLQLQPRFLLLLASDQLPSLPRSLPHIKRYLRQPPLLQHVIPPPSPLTQTTHVIPPTFPPHPSNTRCRYLSKIAHNNLSILVSGSYCNSLTLRLLLRAHALSPTTPHVFRLLQPNVLSKSFKPFFTPLQQDCQRDSQHLRRQPQRPQPLLHPPGASLFYAVQVVKRCNSSCFSCAMLF